MMPVLTRHRGLTGRPKDWFDHEFDAVMRRVWGDDPVATTTGYPVEIREDDEHLYLELEMPGYTKDEVDVEFDRGVLTVSAERSTENKEEKKGEVISTERHHSKYVRRFTLADKFDVDSGAARLENGVLFLTFDKSGVTKPKTIAVNAE